jgi:hypothetical protein
MSASSRSNLIMSAPSQIMPAPQQKPEDVPRRKRGRPRKVQPEGREQSPKKETTKGKPLTPNLVLKPAARLQTWKKEHSSKLQNPDDNIPTKRAYRRPIPPLYVSFHENWEGEEWEISTLFLELYPANIPVIWTRPALPECVYAPADGIRVILTDHGGVKTHGYTWYSGNGEPFTSWKGVIDQSSFSIGPVFRAAKVYGIQDDNAAEKESGSDPAPSRSLDKKVSIKVLDSLNRGQEIDTKVQTSEARRDELTRASEHSRAILLAVARGLLGS